MDQIRSFSGTQHTHSPNRSQRSDQSVGSEYQAKDVSDVSQMGYSNDVSKLNKELGFVTRSLAQHSDALERITARLAEATENNSEPQEPGEGPVR